jgi:hypothetical protein
MQSNCLLKQMVYIVTSKLQMFNCEGGNLVYK